MGFVRKATIISTGGLARAGGVKSNSKKERNAEANEKMAKTEAKRFKAEQKVAKEELKAVKADQRAARAESAAVSASVKRSHAQTIANREAASAAQTVVAQPAVGQGPPPGWYLDPDGLAVQRWWDGTDWSDVTQPIPSAAGPTQLSTGIEEGSMSSAAQPEVARPPVTEPVGISSSYDMPSDSVEADGTDEGESEEPAPFVTEESLGEAQALQFGQVACDGETVAYVSRMGGKTNLVKMKYMGRKPIMVKLGKSGMLDMKVASVALPMKGLSAEQCAANVMTIAVFRPDIPVEVPSTEVGAALKSAGVTTAIQVVP